MPAHWHFEELDTAAEAAAAGESLRVKVTVDLAYATVHQGSGLQGQFRRCSKHISDVPLHVMVALVSESQETHLVRSHRHV